MNTLDVIKSSLTREGYQGQQMEQMLAALTLALRTGKAKLVHLGNSVFMVTVTGPGEVEVHLFSDEQGPAIVDNVRKLASYLKNIGVKKAKTTVSDPRFISLVKQSGLPVQIKQTQEMEGNQMQPAYEFTMEM